jgi:hypothetical protein
VTIRSELGFLGICLNLVSQHESDAGTLMFLGRPDRWSAEPHWRCPNDHVSTTFLKSEERGDLCLACGANVRLTFPEDRDGPLQHPHALAICGARGPLGGKCMRPAHHPLAQKHVDPDYEEWA